MMKNSSSEILKCPVCGKIVKAPTNLARHFFGVFDERHQNHCDAIGVNPLDLFNRENVERLAQSARDRR